MRQKRQIGHLKRGDRVVMSGPDLEAEILESRPAGGNWVAYHHGRKGEAPVPAWWIRFRVVSGVHEGEEVNEMRHPEEEVWLR